MLTWIIHNASTIIVATLLLVVIVFIIRKVYLDKKQGNCSGGCSHCGSSAVCHSKDSLVQEYHKKNA